MVPSVCTSLPPNWQQQGWGGVVQMLAYTLHVRAAEILGLGEGKGVVANAVIEMVCREASPSKLQMEVARHFEALGMKVE